MKKVILGSSLIICGMLGVVCALLREAIYFASPNSIASFGGDPMQTVGAILFIAGVALVAWGFAERGE